MPWFDVLETGLAGLRILRRKIVSDERGQFGRIYSVEELRLVGWNKVVAQSNFSKSLGKGTIRGMHYQEQPFAEMKLVTCLSGNVFDVAVDIRKGSPTFLQWRSCELSAENHCSILIPEGFAHGFQCLSEECHLVYFHSTAYEAKASRRLNPKDLAINISWPHKVTLMSEADAAAPMINHDFSGIII